MRFRGEPRIETTYCYREREGVSRTALGSWGCRVIRDQQPLSFIQKRISPNSGPRRPLTRAEG